MIRGRKPRPVELRLVDGNPGKRPVPEVPPPVSGRPKAPAFLKGEARKEWNRCIGLMQEMGTLGKETRAALAVYCKAWQRMLDAEAHVAQHGELVSAPRTGVPMHNPYLAIANQAAATVVRLAAEFGFTPSSRARLGLKDGPEQKDPASRFLR